MSVIQKTPKKPALVPLQEIEDTLKEISKLAEKLVLSFNRTKIGKREELIFQFYNGTFVYYKIRLQQTLKSIDTDIFDKSYQPQDIEKK